MRTILRDSAQSAVLSLLVVLWYAGVEPPYKRILANKPNTAD
jgi:hypothetical protein